MDEDLFLRLISDHGPWAALVFYLLWRDQQKEQATRALLDRNSMILTEIGTLLRERLPRGSARE